MKQFVKVTLIIMAALVSFTACRDNDDDITPSGNYSPIRGGFPQGDSEWDDIIYNIKKEYNVYLLYKDVTEEDMNRTWVSAGTADIFIAGNPAEREKGTWDLPEEQLEYYVNFFNDHIFSNLDGEIGKDFAKSSFPIKIYMINNLRTEPRDFGEDSDESSSGTDTDPNKIIKLGDFDNWAISIPEDMLKDMIEKEAAGEVVDENTRKTLEENMKKMRCIFFIETLKNAIEKGEIDSPDEFWTGFDFSEGKMMHHKDPSQPHFKYKLGFVESINDNFGTGPQKQIFPDMASETKESSCYYWEKGKYEHYNLFTTYIKNAMWFTPEEFEVQYPADLYPMVNEKYNIVVKHMKEEYGIDLVGIAYGKK